MNLPSLSLSLFPSLLQNQMETPNRRRTRAARRGRQLCRLPASLRRCLALLERVALRGRCCRPDAPRRTPLGHRHLLPAGGSRCCPPEARLARRLLRHLSEQSHASGHDVARHAPATRWLLCPTTCAASTAAHVGRQCATARTFACDESQRQQRSGLRAQQQQPPEIADSQSAPQSRQSPTTQRSDGGRGRGVARACWGAGGAGRS